MTCKIIRYCGLTKYLKDILLVKHTTRDVIIISRNDILIKILNQISSQTNEGMHLSNVIELCNCYY